MSYQKELLVAQLAVQRASILTQNVFHEKAKGTLSKDDFSPVTKGDFGAQALIIQAIRTNFPEDEIVAEEEASSLRENDSLRNEMWNLVKDIKLTDDESDRILGGPLKNETEMLEALDGGKSEGGPKGRIWALDPIDGTKGFLRGGQYAVCLGLIVDGDVKVGVIGCPNLPLSDSATLSAEIGQSGAADAETGVLFSAVKGQGATSRPLSQGALPEGKAISMRPVTDISQACFCEGVEAGHSAQDDNAEVARRLGITSPSVRLDSQAKYCSIARGAGDIYLRLPVKADYQEKIWDHAAGDLLVREAGGDVTDITGKRLDFSIGRKLSGNKGVVAAPKPIFEQVINAVRAVYAAKASI
ncbi:3'(2'),5'-bisphosphate nucleotidase [Uncinocarpus reesii 1704]|uniref:3'(2'),5'-bisphosphate nucleotidase n=1 Tax=Uncinocarpus reesii (strain UAMH 1704) TaxID=336963 RepID=C4JGZ8_UNCRE|nr:3'(2'),5'-bisphosphate nucleotidase [Uncinocarpus reesii 1704]EEP76400.1 3'(2'),5'-bisphosphate nucleotidase [Uncinocarpus reesii 1704]